jgi:hypothetical protein
MLQDDIPFTDSKPLNQVSLGVFSFRNPAESCNWRFKVGPTNQSIRYLAAHLSLTYTSDTQPL